MMKILIWALRGLAAVILLQTLFFKFTGAPESIAIFSKLGAEPFGRYGSGLAELLVSVLILLPKWTIWGSLGAIGVMGGAIMSHIFILGIEVADDGGLLFALACVVLIASLLNIFLTKEKISLLGRSL